MPHYTWHALLGGLPAVPAVLFGAWATVPRADGERPRVTRWADHARTYLTDRSTP